MKKPTYPIGTVSPILIQGYARGIAQHRSVFPEPRALARAKYHPEPRPSARAKYHPEPRALARAKYHPEPRPSGRAEVRRFVTSRRLKPAAQGSEHPAFRHVHVKSAALILPLVTSAFAVALSTASPTYSWLGFLALVPLFVVIRTCRPVSAMLAGALWGFSLYAFIAGGWPIASAVGDTSAATYWTGIPISLLGLLPLVLLTCIPAIYAFVGSCLTRRIGFSPFVLGVGWMVVELALEPLGTRHGLLAGTQGNGVLIQCVGEALGYVMVAFIVAYVSALLVTAFAEVRIRVASTRRVPTSAEPIVRVLQQTFSCFPLFTIHPSQPRAPPIQFARVT